MGRSKQGFLDRGEQKRKKAGAPSENRHYATGHNAYSMRRGPPPAAMPQNFKKARRAVVDTRRSAESDSSIIHAVLFCVLAAIVISWALGY